MFSYLPPAPPPSFLVSEKEAEEDEEEKRDKEVGRARWKLASCQHTLSQCLMPTHTA